MDVKYIRVNVKYNRVGPDPDHLTLGPWRLGGFHGRMSSTLDMGAPVEDLRNFIVGHCCSSSKVITVVVFCLCFYFMMMTATFSQGFQGSSLFFVCFTLEDKHYTTS